MKTRFTVGEAAKMCSIPADTLRYYDRIGLISPKVVGENGYRYYDFEDFRLLYTIKYMKKIGMPLSEMKKLLDNRTKERTRANFFKQLEQIDKEIEELQGIRSQLLRNISYFEATDDLDLDDFTPEVMEFPERYVILSCDDSIDTGSPLKDGTRYEMLMCDVMEELCKENYWTMGPNISVKSKDDILSGNFQRTCAAGDMLVGRSESKMMYTVPAGSYACIYHKGSSENISESYQKLIRYIDSEEYAIMGDAYEIFMVDAIDTKIKEELITHIQILVKK